MFTIVFGFDPIQVIAYLKNAAEEGFSTILLNSEESVAIAIANPTFADTEMGLMIGIHTKLSARILGRLLMFTQTGIAFGKNKGFWAVIDSIDASDDTLEDGLVKHLEVLSSVELNLTFEQSNQALAELYAWQKHVKDTHEEIMSTFNALEMNGVSSIIMEEAFILQDILLGTSKLLKKGWARAKKDEKLMKSSFHSEFDYCVIREGKANQVGHLFVGDDNRPVPAIVVFDDGKVKALSHPKRPLVIDYLDSYRYSMIENEFDIVDAVEVARIISAAIRREEKNK